MAMSISQESELAPPVRLANALEGLGRAVRHIADVRAGADLLLEALDAAASMRGRETGNKKASDGIQKVADFMKKALDELQSTGKNHCYQCGRWVVGIHPHFSRKERIQIQFSRRQTHV
jgi:hypothetical protein